jgi:DNA-binding GntR family transcriptional regulator
MPKIVRRKVKSKGKSAAKNDRVAIHDLVYEEIRRSLMLGSFAPGEKVSLRSLAEQVGTSLTPVRGAVSRLIAEGAFETLPNRWVATPVMTTERFDEIVKWRVKMEGEATLMAVENVTAKLIKSLESINRKLIKEVSTTGDRRAVLGLNYDFHFEIYRASGSTVLLPMIESLWLQAGPFSYFSLDSPKDLWDAKHHELILRGFHEKDALMAADGMKNDILATAKFLRERGRYGQLRLRRVVPAAT